MAKVPAIIGCLWLLGLTFPVVPVRAQASAELSRPKTGVEPPGPKASLELLRRPDPNDERPVTASAELSFEDGGSIPEGYATYTLFLIPDEAWASQARREELKNLYERFHEFGRATGPRNLAVWFWQGSLQPDIPRSRKYCDQLGLAHHGPYIVTSAKFPDLLKAADNPGVFDLNGASSETISRILTHLARDIGAGQFVWSEDLDTARRSIFTLPYPRRAARAIRVDKPAQNLPKIFDAINGLRLEEKKLNLQVLIVLFATLLASTFFTAGKWYVRLRKQSLTRKGCIFFVGIVGYYAIYNCLFVPLIADTFVILVLTGIYGLIPQPITKTAQDLRKQWSDFMAKNSATPSVPGT